MELLGSHGPLGSANPGHCTLSPLHIQFFWKRVWGSVSKRASRQTPRVTLERTPSGGMTPQAAPRKAQRPAE